MELTHKNYYRITAVIFAVIALLHALRAVYGWEAVLGGVVIPVWVSWVAVVIAGYLAVRGFQFVGTHSK
jgi:hypothetical protein